LQDLPSDITVDQKQQVIKLIRDYDNLFSRGILDMRRTTLVEHTIDTGQKSTDTAVSSPSFLGSGE